MKKSGRPQPKSNSLQKLLVELLFKEEIEENNIFLAASLAYFFVVFYACLTEQVERLFGIVLILTSTMIVWYLRDRRKETRRKYEEEIESLLVSRRLQNHTQRRR